MIEHYADRLSDDGVAIFLFHGVVPRLRHPVRNYTRKHLPADYFEAVIEALLDRGGAPVSMEQIAMSRRDKPLPSRAFAITFDDGFRNNLTVAAPILERHQVPATVYVTSGFVDENGCSWTDMLEEGIERIENVELHGLGPTMDGRYRTAKEKRRLLDAMRAYVKGTSTVDPYEFATRVREAIGAGAMRVDEDLDQKLTWAEVAELDRHPLFIVGGHSHTHRVMAFLDAKALEGEIEVSLDRLVQHTHHPVRHYSYPEGLEHCYSPAVIDGLKRRGIVCSPTAIDGTNRSGDDPFHLKRITVV